jgi:hypothetical protein
MVNTMVQAYTDASLQTEVTAMHWGTVLPDSLQTRPIYPKSYQNQGPICF